MDRPTEPAKRPTQPHICVPLATLRRRRGFSQTDLADLLSAATGANSLTQAEVSRWEPGPRIPSPYWLGWLAAVLNTSLDPLEDARQAASYTETGQTTRLVTPRVAAQVRDAVARWQRTRQAKPSWALNSEEVDELRLLVAQTISRALAQQLGLPE